MTENRDPGGARLADPGALLATLHTVENGLRVRLRLARPSDAHGVREFLANLSDESRRRRFGAAMPQVPDAAVRHFTFFDPRKRLVVSAMAIEDGRERIVGLADCALLATGVAELSVVVDDSRRQLGVGTLLTEVVATLAIQQGATHLKAELTEENAPMAALMTRLGRTVRTLEDEGEAIHTRLPARHRRHAA